MTQGVLNQKVFKSSKKSPRKTTSVASISAICLVALSGCSAMKVKLGMRVDMATTPAASIEASLPKGPSIAPGQKSPLVVTVTQPDGKVLQTEGQGGGKVQWKDLTLTTSIVTANNKGILSVPHDPRVSDGKVGHVTVTVPSHPDLKAELDVPFRYDVAFTSNFSGTGGSDGMSGTDGLNGMNGSIGSIDPNNPSPGGDGTNGGDGGNGQDGGKGGDAPAVEVMLTLHPGTGGTNDPLLEASVSALGKRRLYLVDPHGGSLTVKADGGAGGSGGRGGRGGQGGMGGAGTPSGRNGSNGADGRNGWDGQPGRGGAIAVTYDPQVKPYLVVLHLSAQRGPQPAFNERPVAPLW